MYESVTVPRSTMMTSTVSEESLARDTDIDINTHTHTHTHRHGLGSTLKCAVQTESTKKKTEVNWCFLHLVVEAAD